MFTGIVQGTTSVDSVVKGEAITSIELNLPDVNGLELGASVAIDGVCLTATKINGNSVGFDIIPETLERTTLGEVEVGTKVNFERSLKFGDELGGHLLSGHVMGTGLVSNRTVLGEGLDLEITAPPTVSKYLVEKGFVALDGISLTIGIVHENVFTLHIIPETLRLTTLGDKQVGDAINLEIDSMTQTIVATVERMMRK